MKKHVADLLSELGDLISEQKLFLSALRHMGASNIWVQFYHLADQSIKLIDIVMFDTTYGNARTEIVNPENVHRVLGVDVLKKKIYGRKTFIIRFEESKNTEEYHLFFAEMAFHVTVTPIYRREHP